MVKPDLRVLPTRDPPVLTKILQVNPTKPGLNTVITIYHLILFLAAGVNSNITRSAVFKHGQIMN
jgi:hypothetical protein